MSGVHPLGGTTLPGHSALHQQFTNGCAQSPQSHTGWRRPNPSNQARTPSEKHGPDPALHHGYRIQSGKSIGAGRAIF